MSKKTSRASLTPSSGEGSRQHTKIDMEAGVGGARWAIPRPSLGTGAASGTRATRQSAPQKPRGSASSQGSSSNHSTHSASSGSLLLSAANLAKVSNQHPSSRLGQSPPPSNYQNNLSAYVHTSGAAHLPGNKLPELSPGDAPPSSEQNHSDPFWSHVKIASDKSQRRDNESVASSTHFTVVNGFTRHGRSTKSDKQMWCCKSSHQITCLVVTMTILFSAGILAAICYVEMRQRKDMGSRFS